eukprot:jgi/Chlat1/652/Chrsp103S01053
MASVVAGLVQVVPSVTLLSSPSCSTTTAAFSFKRAPAAASAAPAAAASFSGRPLAPPTVGFSSRRRRHRRQHADVVVASASANPSAAQTDSAASTSDSGLERDVLGALRRVIDPDFGMDIVACGFVKDLICDASTGQVSFRLELTTPACPVKDMFESQAREYVGALPWVKDVSVKMSAQPPKPLLPNDVPPGLSRVSSIVAVSSCKGGVGKSTVSVNLAYSLAMMGARVGIFDADVYGPSLPTMVSPEVRVLRMDEQTKAIQPTEYLGVKCVSFGFAGQGSAIMRGPMVSGVVNQLLTTTDWGELDYLILDFPPGTGDIQLTICQVVPISAAVIVTTPQKLAFIDVAKGVRMFSKLNVPCVAVVENIGREEILSVREGVVSDFGIPHLFQMPIAPTLSASGDSGQPAVVEDPTGQVAREFGELSACVVQQVAKLRQAAKNAVVYDADRKAIVVRLPGSQDTFALHPATVRRNDRSAQSVDEYTDVAEDIEPASIAPMGNYAVSITWPDGFVQVAPFEQLAQIERLILDSATVVNTPPSNTNVSSEADDVSPASAAQAIMKNAERRREQQTAAA